MKLRNKLIPIMSVATLAATVAPIATSCGNNMTTVDLTKPYNPTIERAKDLTDTSTDAVADFYMNEIMNNPEILKQDVIYFETQKLPERIALMQLIPGDEFNLDLDWEPSYGEEIKVQSSTTNIVANLSMSDIQVNRVEALVAGKKTQFYTVSMSLNYDFEVVLESLSAEPHYQNTYKQTFKSTYKDIPISLYSSHENNTWNLTVDLLDDSVEQLLKYVPNWSFSFETARSLKTVTTINGLSTQSFEQDSDANTITRRSQIAMYEQATYESILDAIEDTYLNYVPYHLSNIEVPEDLVTINWSSLSLSATRRSTEQNKADVNSESTKAFFNLTDEAKKLSDLDGVQIELSVLPMYYDNGCSIYAYANNSEVLKLSKALVYDNSDGTLAFESGEITKDGTITLGSTQYGIPTLDFFTITWKKSQQVIKSATYPINRSVFTYNDEYCPLTVTVA